MKEKEYYIAKVDMLQNLIQKIFENYVSIEKKGVCNLEYQNTVYEFDKKWTSEENSQSHLR